MACVISVYDLSMFLAVSSLVMMCLLHVLTRTHQTFAQPAGVNEPAFPCTIHASRNLKTLKYCINQWSSLPGIHVLDLHTGQIRHLR